MPLPAIAAAPALYSFFTGAGILSIFKIAAIGILFKLIAVFGVGYVVYEGLDLFINTVTSQLNSYLTFGSVVGFSEALQIMHILRLQDAITLIITTYTSVSTLAIASGAIKKLSLGTS